MRILALQLKRIGDLILTTPAIRAMRATWPDAEIALAVAPGCADLLSAIGGMSSGIVLGSGRGFAPWQQVLTGHWDVCVDFTGSDRSALAVAISRATTRATFAAVKRNGVRSLAYNQFADSPVRDRHTADHYLDLVETIGARRTGDGMPELLISDLKLKSSDVGRFALIHPGTARAEKFWLAERWAEVARALMREHPFAVAVSTGPDAAERAHAEEIARLIGDARVIQPPDLLAFAALVSRAALVLSCDTAAVHLAAAFRRPQLALFGPTNPFHWQPRHARAVVISAANPSEPLRQFAPRMKGAPMDRISTETVIRATQALLARGTE